MSPAGNFLTSRTHSAANDVSRKVPSSIAHSGCGLLKMPGDACTQEANVAGGRGGGGSPEAIRLGDKRGGGAFK